ncbi:HvfC/BufC family peptide modification chaperone [Microbulbifer sp.]|uniref:HvfC/BufC family peptide modification chaperone n=1 Tax=Microbulbifer sp. TaxID=1908541 RepID=UPI003F30A8CD
MEEHWAAALLDPEAPTPPDLTSWNGSDPGQRFAVYRNNVVVSLVESLAQTFPVTCELVGEEFFRAMGREFVRARPPRSTLLARYGEGFAEFVDSFPPAASVPYLADMARLEMHCLVALHAADADPAAPQVLEAALREPECLPALRLGLHPSLHCLRSEFAVFSLWDAHRGELDISQVDPVAAECGWILRSGLEVRLLPMCAGDCDFVEALARGDSFGEAAEAAGGDREFDLGRCLEALLRWGMVTSVNCDPV